jgi:energy-coupling factor transporter ATP-binding protein EcfA2
MEPAYDESALTPIGITDWRNVRKKFFIKGKDRLQHIYVIGKSGTGKSTLLKTMAIADIQKGNGFAVIDPHGDVAMDLLSYVPKERINNCIYFDPTDSPTAFNPLADVPPEQRHLAASGLISTFKKIWDSWGPRLEHILRYSLLTLLEYGQGTLLDIQPLLTNPLFRNAILECIHSTHLLTFWRSEFEKYSPSLKAESTAPILNKMGLFQASIPLRKTVGHKKSDLNFRQMLDEGKILIANLSKGKLGEDATSLLGSMLVNAIQLAALSRADKPIDERKPFYLYVDECHSFISLAFADILAEARKYGLGLFLAHQYIDQLDERIRAAVFGNCGTIISFRIGAADAEYLEKHFFPPFTENDLINLPNHAMYLKLMIDGACSKPFSAQTTSIPILKPHSGRKFA